MSAGPGNQLAPGTLLAGLVSEIAWQPTLLYQSLALNFGDPHLSIAKRPFHVPAGRPLPGLPARLSRTAIPKGRYRLHAAAGAWSFSLEGKILAGRGQSDGSTDLIIGIDGQKVTEVALDPAGTDLVLTMDLGGVLTVNCNSEYGTVFGTAWTLFCPEDLTLSRELGDQGKLTISRDSTKAE